MNLKDYNFEKLNMFSQRTDEFLLEVAKEKGFYGGNTPYNRKFSELFFEGGKLVFRCDVTDDFKKQAVPYLKCLMQSFEPKHEDKEAVCALIMSELIVI